MALPEENSKQVKRRRPEVEGRKPLTKMAANKKVPQNVYVRSKSYKRKIRSTVEDLYGNDDVKSDVMKRVEEVTANLEPQFPKMIRYMLPSNVTGGFWLGIKKNFCDHLPKEDSKIVLEDEGGECFETIYLVKRKGLSGGWRKFAVVHQLSEGDVVVFHLVKPTKFKVYIVRAKGLSEEDCALTLLEMRAGSREMNTNHSKDGSQNLNFDTTYGIRMSESVNIDFEEVKSFKDFDIIVDGLVINSELSKCLQLKYYELCCSQKSFLHDNIVKGLSIKLVVGIIAETIRIADALRDPKLATFQDEFSNWEKILKFFLGIGMNVGFLHKRMEQLMDTSSKSNRHKKATLERARAEEEVRNREAKLLEAKKTMNRLEVEIQKGTEY